MALVFSGLDENPSHGSQFCSNTVWYCLLNGVNILNIDLLLAKNSITGTIIITDVGLAPHSVGMVVHFSSAFLRLIHSMKTQCARLKGY